MLERLPWRVFVQWQQFYNDEPFGAEADGVRLGYAAASLGTLLGKPKGRKSWKISDFMPSFKRAKKLTPDQELARLKMMTRMMGGKVIDKRGRRD